MFPSRDSNGAVLDVISPLDKLSQPTQRIIPLLGNHVEVMPSLLQPLHVQLPNALPTLSLTVHEPRIPHHPQVFRDGLPGHVRPLREPGDRHWPRTAEPGDKPKPHLVSQRRKKNRWVLHCRAATVCWQDTPRSSSPARPNLARSPGTPSRASLTEFRRSRSQ